MRAIASPAIGTARLVVADRRRRVRSGVRRTTARGTSLVVAGEALTAADALAACRAQRPDFVLLDLELPGLDLDLISRLAACAGVAVLLQAAPDDPRVVGALRAGVAGLVHRDARTSEVVRALELLAHGAAPLFLRSLSPLPTVPREDLVVTPNVIELSRGGAHRRRTATQATPVAPRPAGVGRA